MNKNIKRTIAMALTIGAFSLVGQTNYNIFTTEANASTSNTNELTDLELTTSSGSSLDLYKDSDYNDELSDDLKAGETYYIKTSSNKVVIDDIDGADKDNVRIFKESSDTSYKVGDDISISSETTTILKVRVYEDKYDKNETYSSSDYNQYTIEVKNTKDDGNNDDEINLSSLKLSSGYINFNENDTSYKLNVAQEVSSIIIQAIPEHSDYTVKINGTKVDENEDYEKTVSLSSDINIIKVKVSDDNDNTKTYTLKIIRTDATQGNDNVNGNNGLHKGWRNKNSVGNQGLHKGWKNKNGAWYYLDNDGNMKTGWLKDTDNNNEWYYLDNCGKMKTGWFKDIDGNWYYLQLSGAMAKNTRVDGYKLGSNGAWIK